MNVTIAQTRWLVAWPSWQSSFLPGLALPSGELLLPLTDGRWQLQRQVEWLGATASLSAMISHFWQWFHMSGGKKWWGSSSTNNTKCQLFLVVSLIHLNQIWKWQSSLILSMKIISGDDKIIFKICQTMEKLLLSTWLQRHSTLTSCSPCTGAEVRFILSKSFWILIFGFYNDSIVLATNWCPTTDGPSPFLTRNHCTVSSIYWEWTSTSSDEDCENYIFCVIQRMKSSCFLFYIFHTTL